jgi:methionyl-tRNA formyltransferase
VLELLTLQAEGKKAMPAAAFATGARLSSGARFE